MRSFYFLVLLYRPKEREDEGRRERERDLLSLLND